MNFQSYQNYLFSPTFIHLAAIFSLFFLTYCYVLNKDFFFCIDDLDGVWKYSEFFAKEFKKKKDELGREITRAYDEKDYETFGGEVVPEHKISTYECCHGDKKHEVGLFAFNPHLGFPGCVLRFIRVNLGKRFCEVGKNKKGHEVYGFQQSARRHHIFSMAVHYINLVLAYFFLKHYVGEGIAFGACLLYSVHPLTTQTVGWISGVMYNLAMLGSLAAIDTSIYIHDLHLAIPLVIGLSFFSGLSLYIGCFTFVIIWFLGFKWLAFSAACVGGFILFWKGSETKNYRVAAFKEQNMDKTSYLNWRKPIVMVKTFWYYFPKVFMPIKMGLYHTWGYFYDDPIERIDGMFWRGVLAILLTLFVWIHGDLAIHLGIIWFLSFWILFSNFITAMQFVADRYVVIPAFGICVILSRFLYPSPFFWVLLGLYAMRTFVHLPTFRNEVDYFLSNFINFPKSEVALGNLGVTYLNRQMVGTAVDTWSIATRVNPFYDVSWYNLYSIYKGNGRLVEARDFLKKCLDAKVIHFKDKWENELKQFDEHLKGQVPGGIDLIEHLTQQWRKNANR